MAVDDRADPLAIDAISPDSGKQSATVDVTLSGAGSHPDVVLDLVGGDGTKPAIAIRSARTPDAGRRRARRP